MNILTNGAKITIANTNEEFHTLDDWGFAIGNNDYIGEPKVQTEYVTVKGKNGVLDISEALTGRPTYSSRSISVLLGGLHKPQDWDVFISSLRNKIDGKIIKLTFDNDPSHFWFGRCKIEGYDRMRDLGKFKLTIPNADPYKYNWQEFNEDWLWDTFNFDSDYITEENEYTITGHTEITIPAGTMPVAPTVIVTNINTFLTVQKYGTPRVIDLSIGENKVYSITVNDESESILIFEGDATFSINYRGGSL